MLKERVYEPRGFTKKVVETLRNYLTEDFGILRGRIPSEALLKIVPLLPSEQLEERQNNSPMLKDFVEVAEKEPRAMFQCYIVTEERSDERITVEGIEIPEEREDLISLIRERAVYPPDEEGILEGYYMMWWD
ncbi:MAG: hypothetical protein ACP5PT_07460 [Brevinematia bacterium]